MMISPFNRYASTIECYARQYLKGEIRLAFAAQLLASIIQCSEMLAEKAILQAAEKLTNPKEQP